MHRTILLGLLALGILINPLIAHAQVNVPAATTGNADTDPGLTTTRTTTIGSGEEHSRTDYDQFDPGFYVGLNGNYALTYEDEDFDDHQNSIYLNTKLGYDFHPNAAVEFETGWLPTEINLNDAELGHLHRVPLFANVVLKAPLGENYRLVPYVSGGFGVMLYGATQEDNVPDIDVDNAKVGFKAAIGADYWFNRNVAANMETGYFFLPNPEARINGVSRDIGVDSWYVGGGLKYKFD